jgi:hypothetical protein
MPVNVQTRDWDVTPLNVNTNFRTMATAFNEVLDNHFLDPNDAMAANANVTLGFNGNFPVAIFAAAATGGAHWTIRPRTSWANVNIQARIIFTAPTGSTNTFSLVFRVSGVASAGLTSSPMVESVSFTVAGPAVANTLLTKTVSTTAHNFSTAQEVLAVGVIRSAPDSNANALHVLGVYLTALPRVLSL